MAHASGLHFTLSLAGAADLDLAVLDFTLDEALSTPFRLTLQVASRDGELSAEAFLDREASLTVWQDGEPLRRVHGLVSEFARGDRGHRRTFYHLEVRPALWRLGLRHNSRIFQGVSPLTIINTLCEERGLTDVAFAVTREPAEREYCVQYRESDLAFIQRLAAEEGLCFFHEFFERGENAEGGHRLVFADDPQVLGGLGPRTYHGRAGGTPPQRHLRKLKQVARVAPASAVLKDYSFKQPAYSQLHEHAADGLDAHAQRDDYEHYDYPGRYKADASGTAFTRIRLEALRRQALTAEAESDLPELAPGTRFTLEGHDLEETNRDWQVLAAVHTGSQPQALEEEAAQADGLTTLANTLVLAPADRAWRPEPPLRPRVDGPQVAFVVGPEGEEIHCDEHGRVKVQFPWDRYAEPNETASAWLRVSQGWAGGGYGSLAIPRIGHEVVVSFLEGDPDQPIITGRTYHAVNTPPYALPEHKTRTVLRTQSHQGEGFNELRFEDQADQEQIWLHAQKDLELLTHNDRTEEIGNDSFLSIHRDRIAEVDSDDHLTVHGNRHAQVDGDDHLIVGASRHEKTARAQLIEAGQEVHHKAGSKTVIDAGAEITLQAGGSFIKLDPSGITIVGAQVKINSGGSPGRGSGQAVVLPRLPGEATPETSEDVTLEPHQTPLLQSEIVAATPLALDAVDIADGLADRCSACEPAVGSPVNPLLGAKLLPAETDFALPAPRPFVFSRGYLSCNARIGVLGQGWSLPGDSLSLTLGETACVVHDAQGRRITFGPLAAGQGRHSPTEQLWIRRGGGPGEAEEDVRWQALSEEILADAQIIALFDGTHYYLFSPSAPDADRWRLTQELDRNGYATTYAWEAGLLVRVEDSAGRHYRFDYEALLPESDADRGQRLMGVKLIQEHDGSAQDDWLVRYSYSPAGDLIAVRHRHGEMVREFEWQAHMLVAHRVPGGLEAHYTWDRHAPDGRVIGQQEAGGLARTYAYHPDHTCVTDSLGREERYHFVGAGPGQRWTAHTRADGSRIEFRYDRAGRQIATLDPLGRETAMARDDQGQIIAQTAPDGSRWTIERDALGQPIRIEGPEGLHWQIERNPLGHPVEITGPEGTTTLAYEDERLPDRPTAVTDAQGATRRLEWNALGQLSAETDCSERRTTYAHDARGHLASVSNALGETTRTPHDVMGRRQSTQLPDGSHWHHYHDAQGRPVEQEGPQGYRQQLFYDDYGRPAQRIDADGSHTTLAYDEAGRLGELTLGNGASYRFAYDVMDRLISETGPDGREQRYAYDAAGQLIERTEVNRPGPDGQPLVTHFEYDANGRLTARHLPETDAALATTERYHWRADGQLAGAENAHGEVTFVFDEAGRPSGEQQ
ncbi:type VI secretion system tip protein VgrG, partial [Halomonas sp. 328]|nr:type VI secretion system tip protein VgrG [Halomonas sp. 328]